MKKLNVLFCGWGEHWLLGTLADNGADLLFEYSPEALRRGIELSPRCLKLHVGAFGNFPSCLQRLPGLVADALPDGWGVQLTDRLFRKQGRAPSRMSPLDRLAFIGERAMGALGFEPAEEIPLPAGALDLLGIARAAQTVAQGRDSDILRQLAWMGGSPQGSRPKVLLQFDAASGQVGAPDNAAHGAPWLIKFPAHGEHKEVCAIEHVYAELARACGLNMPDSRHFDLDRRLAAFGVRRFDREDGMRVPVHTLAGMLHADFRFHALDYGILLRATRLMTRDQTQVQAAFERCVFNVVFNNRDDHARNFSYRMNRDWQWELSPCYDLSFNSGPDGRHRMAVMGESGAPAADDLLRLAADATLPLAWARQVIDRMVAHGGMFAALARTAPIRAATVKTIARAIEGNRKLLALPRT